jgi:DNA polymerase
MNPGKDFRVGKVVFRSGALNGVPFLTCILPSGRRIRYCNPSLMDDERFKDKKKLCYWSTKEGHWQKIDTYGGSLCENITQAVARDILAGAIVGCENASIPVVLHVHDEIVAESTADNLDKFKAIMTAVPEWAEGLPLEVKAFTSKRYGKE